MHTQPSYPGLRLHLLNADSALDEVLDVLRTSIHHAWDLAAPQLQLAPVDIVVRHDPQSTIPEWGVGGYTSAAHVIFLAINAQRLHSEQATVQPLLRPITIHELHHCARWASPGYGSTLGEALVSEGLACLMETEYSDGQAPFYATALDAEGLASTFARALAEKDAPNYNHANWFYGSNASNLPRHAGYALGYALVAHYAHQEQLSAAALAHVPAYKIWEQADAWREVASISSSSR